MPPKRAAKKESPAFEIIDDVEQGTDEWLMLRLGLPTASNFGIIMAEGRDGNEAKTKERYRRVLAGEVMTGRPGEGKIITAAMQRGKDMEPEARAHYEKMHLTEVREVGFIRRRLPNGRYVGASPDGLIGSSKVLEIKTMEPALLIERLEKGAGMPPEHRAQVQGSMWIGDFEEAVLKLFYRGMPVSPEFTVYRDDVYIDRLAKDVEIFEHEVHRLVEKIRRMV